MKMDAINPIFIVAKKEIMDNIRNKWIILVTVLFAALTLLASYAGSIFSEGWQDFEITVGAMSGLVQIFISIIGLMLGYAAIVGEIELVNCIPRIPLLLQVLLVIVEFSE